MKTSFTDKGLSEYMEWLVVDKKKLKKINELIKNINFIRLLLKRYTLYLHSCSALFTKGTLSSQEPFTTATS